MSAGGWPRLGASLALWSLILVAACQRLPIAPPTMRPEIQSAQDLQARLRARARGIHTFKAKGRVTVVSPEKTYSGTALLLGQKPKTLRVEVLNFWGQSALSFFTDGRTMQILDYREGRLRRGPATPQNLALFVPPPVQIGELLQILTGSVPLPREGEARMTFVPEKDQYQLELTAREPETRVAIRVDAQNLRILAATWYEARGRVLYQVRFQDFDDQQRYPVPRRIILATGDNRAQLRLHYRELTLNPPLDPETLSLSVPSTVREVPLSP